MVPLVSTTWHARCGWKAEAYFDDPKVIELCRAIEADDLKEIDRLIEAGANVNAIGKAKMTLLLWAFPDNKLDRFKRLLEKGANPNVVVESDFNSKGYIHPGHSVTQLAAGTKFPEYLNWVMLNGGDPGILDTHSNDNLLHTVIMSNINDKKERVQLLIDMHIDVDHVNNMDVTPTMWAVSWGAQYDIALILLKAGADPRKYAKRSNKRLVHSVVEEGRVSRNWSVQAKQVYQTIVQRLVDHGESLEDAGNDLDRWMEQGKVHEPAKFRELREKEVADRVAREKAKAEKVEFKQNKK